MEKFLDWENNHLYNKVNCTLLLMDPFQSYYTAFSNLEVLFTVLVHDDFNYTFNTELSENTLLSMYIRDIQFAHSSCYYLF